VDTRTVNLRNLPDDLVRKAKAVAAWKGISLKEFVIQAIQQSLTSHHAASAALFVTKGKKKR
jgi:predicted HicB family RNase H-like nuclease